ncbi:uncharacterized protein [Bactrocera oleae]|uniref:uncharacterized protein n=1 Tax=Bactrocera oleae TaxID=104688 RepID=UPI00174C127E|nr:uncharacterized protein LOC118681383 [Bactrocera oleae]
MDGNAPTPTPAIRSAVNVPRPGANPAPRTTATTAPPIAPSSGTRPLPPSTSLSAEQHRLRCPLCRHPHRLQHCGIFKGMPPVQRQQIAQAHGHCLNCLAHTHATTACESRGLCQMCGEQHHTLLHRTARRDNGRLTASHRRGVVRRLPRQASARPRRSAPPPEPRSWRPRHDAITRRSQLRPQPRRATGLSSVVYTLQQLQRLLG